MGAVRRLGLPLLVWACAAATIIITAAALGYHPFDSSTWSRWDSGNYENIARDGYEVFHCEDEPDKWCGDAAWFPAYSWIFGGLHRLGLPFRGTAVAVSWLFAAGTIVLLWSTFLRREATRTVLAGLLFAAFAPGIIYHYAVFPLSMLAFFTVACLWLVYRERYAWAGIAGSVAALTYPAGVLLAPITAFWLVARRSVPLTERLVQAAITSGLTLVGFWVLVLDQQLETGHWNAFFLVQEKYEALHGSQNPFVTTWNVIRGGIENPGSGIGLVVASQTVLVTLVLALVVIRAIRDHQPFDSVDTLVLVWALTTWVMLFQAFSLYRGQAALLPVAVLVARLPAKVAWPLATASAGIAIWLERYFLDSTLI
jgi:hypothetical protein